MSKSVRCHKKLSPAKRSRLTPESTMAVFFALFITLATVYSCNKGGNSNVFEGADRIIISSPTRCTKVWFGSGNFSDADFFKFGKSATTLGIDEKRVFAAVFFEHPPLVNQATNLITNTDNVVWAWDSGLESEAQATKGLLKFTDGVAVTADGTGTPATQQSCNIENTCQTLRSKMLTDSSTNKPYFFAAWAWDSYRNISFYSDDPVPFCWTNDKNESGKPCTSIEPGYCITQ